ncbi:MAG: hypothetical protein ACRD3W_29385 [Terriglobales bacterium]
MKRFLVGMSLALTANLALMVTPARAVETPEYKYHAVRFDYGTSCEWRGDGLNTGFEALRLESYAALVKGGHCAEIVKFNPGPDTVQIEFDVHFNKNFAISVLNGGNHVDPTCVVEYEENNQDKYLTLTRSDFAVSTPPNNDNRERWSYNFIDHSPTGAPLANLKRIGVGGGEIKIKERGGKDNGTYPMDIVIYRLKILQHAPPGNKIYNTNVQIVGLDDKLLDKIKGTFAKP